MPFWDRYDTILARLRAGETPEALAAEADVHIWFLHELARMVAVEEELVAAGLAAITPALWRRAKRHGLGDSWLAKRLGAAEADVRAARLARRRAPGLQGGRLVRRRGRGAHAATATRRTRTSTSRSTTTGRAC